MYGVNGKGLLIDLEKRTSTDIELKEGVYRRFLGGIGTASYWMMKNELHLYDAYSPENPLIFSTGPLTGTKLPSSGRFSAITISPLTGLWSSSVSGTVSGVQLKKSGYDMMVITGKSESPAYITVDDGDVQFHDAGDLWGCGVSETVRSIRKEHRGSIMAIGQAGENLVRFASIMCDRGRAFGRAGFGAVMGSKNLKAIVVRGTGDVELASKEDVDLFAEELKSELMENEVTKNLRKFGTSGLTSALNYMGILPTKYFKRGQYELADDLSGDEIFKKFKTRNFACFACPIACGKKIEYGGKFTKAPEYETVAAFGPLLLNPDYDVIMRVGEKCDEYGLDTISTGNVCGFALEAMERGILKGGRKWGDGETILKLVDEIAFRKGYGKILAEGVARSSKHLNVDFGVHVKGLESAMHEPRGMQTLALGYATALRGCDHLTSNSNVIEMFGISVEDLGIPPALSEFTKEDVEKRAKVFAWAVKRTQDFWTIHDALILCKFTTIAFQIPPKKFPTMLHYVTGISLRFEDFMRIGERIFNTVRLIQRDRGAGRENDTLPKRFLREGLPKHEPQGWKGEVKDFDRLLDEYYRIRGWDKNGHPVEEILDTLEIFPED